MVRRPSLARRCRAAASSRRMKSWNTAAICDRHEMRSKIAQVDTVDLDRAALRLYSRHSNLARVVLPSSC